MAILWLLLGAVLVVIGSVFYAQNPGTVDLNFWTTAVPRVPIWLIAVGPAIVGLLIGFLMALPGRLRGALAARRLSGQLQERDRTIGKLQERINELDRDLAIARASSTTVVTEEHRIADVPDGTIPRTETHAA